MEKCLLQKSRDPRRAPKKSETTSTDVLLKSDSTSSASAKNAKSSIDWPDPCPRPNHKQANLNPTSDSTDSSSKLHKRSNPSKSSSYPGKSVGTSPPPAESAYPVASTSNKIMENNQSNASKNLNLTQLEKCFFPNCKTSFLLVNDFAVLLHFVRHFAHHLVQDLPANSPYSCPICSIDIGNRRLLLVHYGLCHLNKLESIIKSKIRREHLKVSYIDGNKTNVESGKFTLLPGSKKYKTNCFLCGKIVNLCKSEQVETAIKTSGSSEDYIQGALRYHLQSRHFSGFCPPMEENLRCPDCGKDMASKERYLNHFMHRHLGKMFVGMTEPPNMYDFFTSLESFTDLVELDMKKLGGIGSDVTKLKTKESGTKNKSLVEPENSNSMTKYCSDLAESAGKKLKTSRKRSITKTEEPVEKGRIHKNVPTVNNETSKISKDAVPVKSKTSIEESQESIIEKLKLELVTLTSKLLETSKEKQKETSPNNEQGSLNEIQSVLTEDKVTNTKSIEGSDSHSRCICDTIHSNVMPCLTPIIIKKQENRTENQITPILNGDQISPTLKAVLTHDQGVLTNKESSLGEVTAKNTESIQGPTVTTTLINEQGNLTGKQSGLEEDTVEGPTLTANPTYGQENLTETRSIPSEDELKIPMAVAGLSIITNGQRNLIETQCGPTRDEQVNLTDKQKSDAIENPYLIMNEQVVPVEKQKHEGNSIKNQNIQIKEECEERNSVKCSILLASTNTQDDEVEERKQENPALIVIAKNEKEFLFDPLVSLPTEDTRSRHSSTESKRSSEYLEEEEMMMDVKEEEVSMAQNTIKVENISDVNEMKVEVKEEIKDEHNSIIASNIIKEQILPKKAKENLVLDSIADEIPGGVYALVFLEVTAILDASATQYTQIGCHVRRTDEQELTNGDFFVAISPTKMASYVDSLNHRDIVSLLYKMKINFSGKESCYKYIKPDVSTIDCISEDNAMLELLVFLKRVSFGLDGIIIIHNSEKLVLPIFAKRRMQFSIFGDKHIGFINLQEILHDYLGLNEQVPDLLEAHQRLVLNSIDKNPFVNNQYENADCSNTSKFLFEVMNKVVSCDYDNLVHPYCISLSMLQKGEVWKNIILKKYEGDGMTVQLCRSCEPGNPLNFQVTKTEKQEKTGPLPAIIQTNVERQIENETTPKPDVREHEKQLHQETIIKQMIFPYSSEENMDMSLSSNESNYEKSLIENNLNAFENSYSDMHLSMNPLFNPLYYSVMEPPALDVSSECCSPLSNQVILPATSEQDSPQVIAEYSKEEDDDDSPQIIEEFSNKRLRLIDQQQLFERTEPTEVQKAKLSGITELTTKGSYVPIKDNPNCKCDTLSLCGICRCFQVFSDQNFSSDDSVYTFVAKVQDDEGILVKKCIRFIENQALRCQGRPSPFSQVRRVYTGGKHILLTVESDQKVNIKKNDLIGICQIWKGCSHSDLQDHHQQVLKCGESKDQGGGMFELTLMSELRPKRHLPVVVQTVPWLNVMTKLSTLTSEGMVKVVCKNVATITDRVPNVGDMLAHATTRVSKNIIPSITGQTIHPEKLQVEKKRKLAFTIKKKVPNLVNVEDPIDFNVAKRFKPSFCRNYIDLEPYPQKSNVVAAPKKNTTKIGAAPKENTSKLGTAPKANTTKLGSAPKANTSKLCASLKDNTSKLCAAPEENTLKLSASPEENTSKLNSAPKENTSKLNSAPKENTPQLSNFLKAQTKCSKCVVETPQTCLKCPYYHVEIAKSFALDPGNSQVCEVRLVGHKFPEGMENFVKLYVQNKYENYHLTGSLPRKDQDMVIVKQVFHQTCNVTIYNGTNKAVTLTEGMVVGKGQAIS